MPGPLEGIRVLEIAGIGPVPFVAMMLADAGADVLRIDRVGSETWWGIEKELLRRDLVNRGRRSVAVDLKNPDGVEMILKLAEGAHGLVEGFRPGVAERLGIGPERCFERNPGLVYGRMTGWGQSGRYAKTAGHDINYIALSGALDLIGRAGDVPVPPVNLVGDFGGGGMLLAFGMVCAFLEQKRSGLGQVVDAAMVDGAALLTTFVRGMKEMGLWQRSRGENLIDTGAPFYEVYATADDRYIAVGAIEPQFYGELLRLAGIDPEGLPAQMDETQWLAMKERFAAVFATRTRDEWCQLLDGTDACFSPVLSMDEAVTHPHNLDRSTFIEVDGVVQPAPAPRFSRTRGVVQMSPPVPGEHGVEALRDWGIGSDEINRLQGAGVIEVS
ncbi:MAG: CaiB/BaiF CoA transferase family protein [Acidimicrobiales bacterium]